MNKASERPDSPSPAPYYYLPVPDFDDPEVVVSELPEPLVEPVEPLPLVPPLVEPAPVVPLPVVPVELPEPLVLGVVVEVPDPLIPPELEPVDPEVELPASRPSVALRSEHAPRASVASAAATATPIARVLI
ncbi:MAG: hypothetical protein ACXW2G_05965 [Burkholderiaceae bacterium]